MMEFVSSGASDPTVTVLAWSTAAALTAILGVVPRLVFGRLSPTLLGAGNALAAGLMLGVAYLLLVEGLPDGIVLGAVGGLCGAGIVILTHALTGTTELDLNALDELDPAYGYQVVLVNALHAAGEGVAIGVAMLVSLPFGISMAVALAVHNVPEAMVLIEILTARGVRLAHAGALAAVANLNQVLLAVVTFAVIGALPSLMPWAVGFAVGALLQLLLSELLPESYRQTGHTSIAVVTLLAMGLVIALLGGAA
ncbi:ZIP family metal transporter [Gaopeijia maritima]|uniref:ZIP family metal transporter n=1 Tax=Gaopeijia maritima TaxID=3119007 RepID=A0ABU9EDA6_9BACT